MCSVYFQVFTISDLLYLKCSVIVSAIARNSNECITIWYVHPHMWPKVWACTFVHMAKSNRKNCISFIFFDNSASEQVVEFPLICNFYLEIGT